MMAFEPISEEIYDKAATFITYAKVFPYVLRDFITREDAKEMLSGKNLPVTTNAGQVVATTGSPTAQTGSTVSIGTGKATPIYNGAFPSGGSEILKQSIKAQKEAGGTAIEGTTAAFSAVTG